MAKFSSLKKSEWQKYAQTFKRFQPPWRPSTERITIYRQLIKKYVLGKRVLILGATPETRDLLAKMKFDVTLVDISPLMVRAMTSLRQTKSKEKIIINSWLTLKAKPKFDLIMGDSVMNNLHPNQYQKFLQQMRKLLKDDGVLILQQCVLSRPFEEIKMSLEDMVRKVKTRPDYYKNYLNRAYDYQRFWFSHAKNHLYDLGQLEIELQKVLINKNINPKQFSLLKMNFNSPTIISFYTTKQFEAALKKYWQIIWWSYEKKHKVHQDFYRIYVLKK